MCEVRQLLPRQLIAKVNHKHKIGAKIIRTEGIKNR